MLISLCSDSAPPAATVITSRVRVLGPFQRAHTLCKLPLLCYEPHLLITGYNLQIPDYNKCYRTNYLIFQRNVFQGNKGWGGTSGLEEREPIAIDLFVFFAPK